MFKIVLICFFGFLFLIQLIQIDIAESKEIDPKAEIQGPEEIMAMLKRSCYDCHSYETKMPWYGNIAPFSWEVRNHIKDGRKWLNFQEWQNYDEDKKQKHYQGIYESIGFSMPIPMYISLHKDAELTKAQKLMIEKWAQGYIEKD